MSGESWGELALALLMVGVVTAAAALDTLSALVSRQRLRQLADGGSRRRSVQALLDPRRLLSASLLTVQVAAVAAGASLLTTTIRRELGAFDHLLSVVAIVLAFLVLGQALPRALARNRPDATADVVLAAAGCVALLVRPFGAAVEAIGRLFDHLLPGSPDDPMPAGTEEELRTITLDDTDSGVIEADEREMIDGVLHLEEIRVRDIMVPRVDIVAVERSVPPRELLETIVGKGHSRIPVYQETIDRIIGVVYAKDLLQFVIGTTEALPLVSLLRPPYVVPESKRIDDLLKELRRAKVHIAIVADEYGGTAGLVTIEDILEEIVGEIQDEYDTEVPLFEIVGPGELVADGRLALEDVEDRLEVAFEEDDYGTLGGFVQKHLGRLPEQGDRFEAEGVAVAILEVERHRVRRLRVTKLAPSSPEGAADGDHSGEPLPLVVGDIDRPAPAEVSPGREPGA